MSEEKINFGKLNYDMNTEERSAAYSYLIGCMKSYFGDFKEENISKEKLYKYFSDAVNYAKKERDFIR